MSVLREYTLGARFLNQKVPPLSPLETIPLEAASPISFLSHHTKKVQCQHSSRNTTHRILTTSMGNTIRLRTECTTGTVEAFQMWRLTVTTLPCTTKASSTRPPGRAHLPPSLHPFINPALYTHPYVLNDITNGTNPGCGTVGFEAVKGWGEWILFFIYTETLRIVI
jgi:hypothetical protein